MRGLGPIVLIPLVLGLSARAQTLDPEALGLVSQTAAEICGDFAAGGSASDASLEGAAQARLKGLAGKLVDLGVEGAGEIATSEYAGVLREELGDELRDVRACRLQIWKDLQHTLTAAPPAGGDQSRRDVEPEAWPESGDAYAALPPEADPELAERWTYIGLCPDATGMGQFQISGWLEISSIGPGEYSGSIGNNLGYFGQVRSRTVGQSVMSEVRWSDYSVTIAEGSLGPDGVMTVRDSAGCVSEFYPD